MERSMTPDELARFEREELHHEDETKPDAGPASDPDLVADESDTRVPPTIPPNPD